MRPHPHPVARWPRQVAAAVLVAAPVVLAETVYLEPQAFIDGALGDGARSETLWLTPALRDAAAGVLGHDPGVARVRYWSVGPRSAWILEAIGKEEPITAGFIIESGVLATVSILVYRESRGWEVRLPAFTDQFEGARLDPDHQLDVRVDNISGATLSVSALTRLARLALFYAAEAGS